MPTNPNVTYVIFLIFAGTALLSTIALYSRQSLMMAYITLGAILGPWGFNFIQSTAMVSQAGEIGIIFLLFLLGLDLQPQSLLHSLRKMSVITLASSVSFFLIALIASLFFGYPLSESFIIGISAMFSSTIISIKLLPTSTLHHQHTGELAISILLLQDIIAIMVLLAIEIFADRAGSLHHLIIVASALPILLLVAYVFERFVLSYLFSRFDKIHEYIFILSIGWCLCMVELSHALGMSEEIGAFIAGVTLASLPIAAYIAESLKPLRDFFLVIFFFAIGANFNFANFPIVMIPACTIALLMLFAKPYIFKTLLQRAGEVEKISNEIGIRLGQLSEFSLLVIFLTLEKGLLSNTTGQMIQGAVILTFIASCYWTVKYYPTPLAITDTLRKD